MTRSLRLSATALALLLQQMRDTPPEVEADPAAYHQAPQRKGPARSAEPGLYPSDV